MPVPLRAVHHRGEAKHNVTTDFPSLGLHSAASTGNVGLVEYALSRGQPVNSVVDGVLPLHAACAGGNVQVVKLLIEYGADVNAPRLSKRYSSRDASAPIIGTTGSTPLHFAAANGNRDAIMLLLLHGAHANKADKHGITPENLARQNGWIECADLLKEWILNKDKDLREREEFVVADDKDGVKRRNPLGSFGDEPSFTSRHRLHVKHSIDTALNMLKSSSSNLSELYRGSHTPTPPTSPTKPLGDFASQLANFNGERSSSRRPSLPHIGHHDVSARPRNSYVQLVNPHQSNSTGEDGEDTNPSQSKGGSARKIGSKVSLLNLFRKGQNSDGSSTPDLNSGTNSIVNDTTPLSTSPSTGSALRRSRPHQGSDASNRSRRAREFSTERIPSLNSPARSPVPVPVPVPVTTDLNNNPQSLGQPNRDRSRSNASSQYNDDPITSGSYHSTGTSPLARLGMFRNQGHHRTRSGSGSSSGYDVTVPSRLGTASTVVADDVQINRAANNVDVESLSRSLPRTGIFKPHNRNGSNGQGHMTPSALRAIRYDVSSFKKGSRENHLCSRDTSSHSQSPRGNSARLKSSNSSNSLVRSDSYSRRRASLRPGSAGSGSKLNIEEEGEEEYGKPIEPTKTSLIGIGEASARTALSPIMSNGHVDGEQDEETSQFPFSINSPPLLPIEGDIEFIPSPLTQHVADNRQRGNSLSSTNSQRLTQSPTNIATALMITPPLEAAPQSDKEALSSRARLMEGEGVRSHVVSDAVPKLFLRRSPPLSVGESADQMDSNRDSTSTLVLPSTVHLSNGSMNGRRTHTPFEIDLSSISTHAQAEALVERTRNQVMELASSDGYEGISTPGNDGRTPLSARLAAYGESLALERKFREQENGVTNAANSATMTNGRKSGVSSRTSLLLPITSQHSREGSGYSSSLYSGKSAIAIKETPSRRSVDDVWNSMHARRPSTAEGLASREVNLSRSSDQSDWPSPSTRSVSAMGYRRTEASPSEQNSVPSVDLLSSSVTDDNMIHQHKISSSQGYHARSITSPPGYQNDGTRGLRMASLDGVDFDKSDHLGVPLCRVTTTPTPVPRLPLAQTQGRSAKKLSKMGISVADQAGRGAIPPPAHSGKKFINFRYFFKSSKG